MAGRRRCERLRGSAHPGSTRVAQRRHPGSLRALPNAYRDRAGRRGRRRAARPRPDPRISIRGPATMMPTTPTTTLDARSVRRRYLGLIGLRWLPTGLLIPVVVLLAQFRGLSLTEIGFVFSLQGLVVLALELPTGGLSDALGRRPTLLIASAVGLAALGLLTVADSVALFAASTILMGVYRALDSGPLEAWFVDSALAADPATEIEKGLSAGGMVSSIAI